MADVQTFVTVHDADLLAECEREGRFKGLEPYAYLFVGSRSVDRLQSGFPGAIRLPKPTSRALPGSSPTPSVKIVVARDHHPNVEHLPDFYDFTGWWVLARHRLIVAPRVMFLQYDMRPVLPDLRERVVETLGDGEGPVSFAAGSRSAGHWDLAAIAGFYDAYLSGMAELGVDPDTWDPFEEWPTTQGTAWHTDEFYAFIDWFRPLFDIWGGNMWAGHLAERTVKAWCELHGLEPRYLLGAVEHETRDCHGTSALMSGNRSLYNERQRTYGRVNQSS